MARLVPSQVVSTIDQLPLNMVPVTNSRRYSIGESHALQGVIELVEQIPKELLTMSPSTYSDFVVCLAMIRGCSCWRRVEGCNRTGWVCDRGSITLGGATATSTDGDGDSHCYPDPVRRARPETASKPGGVDPSPVHRGSGGTSAD